MRTKCLNLLLLASVGLVVSGCSQKTLNSAQQDTNHNIKVLNQKADQVAKEAKPQLKKADMEARVEAALTASKNLNHTDIHVRADTNGIYLRGTVQTAQQKQIAQQIAQDTLGPDKTVTNQLQVSSKAP